MSVESPVRDTRGVRLPDAVMARERDTEEEKQKKGELDGITVLEVVKEEDTQRETPGDVDTVVV